jgi:predicted phosphatase
MRSVPEITEIVQMARPASAIVTSFSHDLEPDKLYKDLMKYEDLEEIKFYIKEYYWWKDRLTLYVYESREETQNILTITETLSTFINNLIHRWESRYDQEVKRVPTRSTTNINDPW